MNKLGLHGKDVITGFEGTITSEHHYLTGCTQLGLQPSTKEDGTLGETMYFDETRVKVSGEVVELAVPRKEVTLKKGCDCRERP
jgi:hypothetical protein